MGFWIEDEDRLDDEPGQTELLLLRMGEGDVTAAEELLPLVYGELHRLASGYMQGERASHTLQATALLNEAWVRLAGKLDAGLESRSHFLGVAARAMRQVLIDHARRRGADKRGGGALREDFDHVLDIYQQSEPQLLSLNEALERLEAMDPQLARIVELRFFGGAENREVAAALNMSLRSVERGWQTARTWLRAELDRMEQA